MKKSSYRLGMKYQGRAIAFMKTALVEILDEGLVGYRHYNQ